MDYSENLQEDGTLGEWNHSLFVLATVISKNVADRRAVVDAGLKSISFDSGPPRLWPVDKFNNVAFHNGGDEHGIIQYPEVRRSKQIWMQPFTRIVKIAFVYQNLHGNPTVHAIIC